MGKIVCVLNPKGGSGKTTISTHIMSALHRRGLVVLGVDSDPQGSARDWHAVDQNNPIDLAALDRPATVRTLGNLHRAYDYVVVDGAAKLEDMLAACVKIADLVIIPVQPSPYDVWAASDLVDFIHARREVTDGRPAAAFVISRAVDGTKLGDDVRRALDEYELPVLNTVITQRQVYPQTASDGQTVFDASNAKAKAEMESLVDEIVELVG